MFAVEDPIKPASIRTGGISIDYIGISDLPNEHGRYKISLSAKLEVKHQPNRYGNQIACAAFDKEGKSLSGNSEVWHRDPIIKNWYVFGKPARIEFVFPDMAVIL